MANMKFFADQNGETVELTGVHYVGRKLVGQPVGFVPTWDEENKRWNRNLTAVSRTIEYKRQPSRHECDDRCVHATGRVMRCECACGGKNHGKGH